MVVLVTALASGALRIHVTVIPMILFWNNWMDKTDAVDLGSLGKWTNK